MRPTACQTTIGQVAVQDKREGSLFRPFGHVFSPRSDVPFSVCMLPVLAEFVKAAPDG
jgi:hypothetical protein